MRGKAGATNITAIKVIEYLSDNSLTFKRYNQKPTHLYN